jgi:biopolymer transport protein ExbD
VLKSGGPFERKSSAEGKIPSSSMADIAFLLLIFFMVSTVFRTEQGLKVEFPEAQATEKVEERRKDILHLWIDPAGNAYIDDVLIPTEEIAFSVKPVLIERPRLVVAVRADQRTPFGEINKALDQLKIAEAVRVNFATVIERD